MTSTRDNEETSLRMMIDRAYELLDKRTEECVQKHGNANAVKSLASVAPTCIGGRRMHGGREVMRLPFGVRTWSRWSRSAGR